MPSPTVRSLPPLALLAVALLPDEGTAQTLVRGPILQAPHGDRITVIADLDAPARLSVHYTDGEGVERIVEAGEESVRHELVLDGLAPGMDVPYQLFVGEVAVGPAGVAPTAPASDAPFRFYVFGDTRSRSDVHAAVIDAMMGAGGGRFAVQTGDLVSDGESLDQWMEYFRIEQPLGGSVPIYPVIGNHDEHAGAAEHFTDLFATPSDTSGREEYYSFDAGNVHGVVIDLHTTNSLSWVDCVAEYDLWLDGCVSPEQQAWLETDLGENAANPEIEHTLVFAHIGPYSSKDGRSGSAWMRWMLPFLEEMGVTAIISGHDHYYERGESHNGIAYLITGGGGAPLYEVSDPSRDPHTVVTNESVEHYVVVDVNGSDISFTATTLDGRELDRFTLHSERNCATDSDCTDTAPHEECDPTGAPICSVAGRCFVPCEPLLGGNPLAGDDDPGVADAGGEEIGPADAGERDAGTADTEGEDGHAVDVIATPEIGDSADVTRQEDSGAHGGSGEGQFDEASEGDEAGCSTSRGGSRKAEPGWLPWVALLLTLRSLRRRR